MREKQSYDPYLARSLFKSDGKMMVLDRVSRHYGSMSSHRSVFAGVSKIIWGYRWMTRPKYVIL